MPSGSAKAASPKPAAKKAAPKKAAPKEHVFLIAVKRRREALRVYAVRTDTEAEALAIVEAASEAEAAVEPVGRLSKKLARPLKLTAREPRLI